MQAQTLEKYLHDRAKPAPDVAAIRIKWQQRLDLYLTDVHVLFGQIREWLKPLETEGLVKIEEKQTSITEENLETYSVPELKIFLSDQLVAIKPRGTNIFGAFGRIDALGTNGSLTIVLINWGHWQFVRKEYAGQGSSNPFYTDVSEEEFKKALYMLIAE